MRLVDKIGQCVDAEVLRQCRRYTFCVCERQATELFIAIGEDENRLRVLDLNPVDLSAVDAEVLAKEAAKVCCAGSVLMCSQGW